MSGPRFAGERRLPLDELLAAVPVGLELLAEFAGVSDRTLHRWRHEGGIPESAADRACTAVGLHPVDVWSYWYDRRRWPR